MEGLQKENDHQAGLCSENILKITELRDDCLSWDMGTQRFIPLCSLFLYA